MTAVIAAPGPDVLPAEQAAALDCLQANLAVLADAAHGPDTHLRLGHRLELRWRRTRAGLHSVERDLADHLADAADLLGLVPVRPAAAVPAAQVPAALRPDGPSYLVADAYALPWTPYHRRQHMSHSFLVTPAGAGYRVLDAYHNDTPWGRARPAEHRIGRAELTAALAPAADVLWLDPVPLPPADPVRADRPPIDRAAVEAYLRPYRQAAAGLEQLAALNQLTLESWLLQRSRKLHAAYLVHTGARAAADLAGPLAGWARLTEQVYLALRRAQRGREVPAGVLDRLADQLLADGPAFAPATGTAASGPVGSGGTARTADPNWVPFADVVAGVLDVPADRVGELGSLLDAPECTSLRVVEIVEGLESRFDLRFTGDDLAPELLYDIDHLLALVSRGVAR